MGVSGEPRESIALESALSFSNTDAVRAELTGDGSLGLATGGRFGATKARQRNSQRSTSKPFQGRLHAGYSG
jgi:hypothetical protein